MALSILVTLGVLLVFASVVFGPLQSFGHRRPAPGRRHRRHQPGGQQR